MPLRKVLLSNAIEIEDSYLQIFLANVLEEDDSKWHLSEHDSLKSCERSDSRTIAWTFTQETAPGFFTLKTLVIKKGLFPPLLRLLLS